MIVAADAPNQPIGAVSVAANAPSWTFSWMRARSSVPAIFQRRNMPRRKPASPIRLTTNAFSPAWAFSASVHQNPISR